MFVDCLSRVRCRVDGIRRHPYAIDAIHGDSEKSRRWTQHLLLGFRQNGRDRHRDEERAEDTREESRRLRQVVKVGIRRNLCGNQPVRRVHPTILH